MKRCIDVCLLTSVGGASPLSHARMCLKKSNITINQSVNKKRVDNVKQVVHDVTVNIRNEYERWYNKRPSQARGESYCETLKISPFVCNEINVRKIEQHKYWRILSDYARCESGLPRKINWKTAWWAYGNFLLSIRNGFWRNARKVSNLYNKYLRAIISQSSSGRCDTNT